MRQKIKIREKTALKNWSIGDSKELYLIDNWGKGFFDVNDKGNIIVKPEKNLKKFLDIKKFVEDMELRGINTPILIRFTDILKKRIEEINNSFKNAIKEYNFKGKYIGVYPIKVNQNRQVVEDIVEFGEKYNYGLEAGSKPELLITLSLLDDPERPIICNGYKDKEFIELALWGKKLGKQVIIVVEKPSELDLTLEISKEIGVKPLLGIRAKLSAKGRGKWEASGGDKSKFGLFPSQILEAVEKLKRVNLIENLILLHFHLGSQITSIQSIKEALRESTRIFSELHKLGINFKYFDVGGGLAVDYDGSQTNFSSSSNYTLQEYASDVISAISEICEEENIPHPNVISESGRALVAYHSVIIVNVLGISQFTSEMGDLEEKDLNVEKEDSNNMVSAIKEVYDKISLKNIQESYHDALQIRDETLTMFNVGVLSLKERALVEKLFWKTCQKIYKISKNLDYIPDELEDLDRFISDIYFCNFSVFQSLPDHWAVKQLFPIAPIHRLTEEPTHQAILADITCDSDGKIDQFIDLRDVKSSIKLHELKKGENYYLGIFLSGAYQEILGDLHNLFGDTHTVHISIIGENKYKIDKIIEGDSIKDVLGYMQYTKKELISLLRNSIEKGIENKTIELKDSSRILKYFESELEKYTYLEN